MNMSLDEIIARDAARQWTEHDARLARLHAEFGHLRLMNMMFGPGYGRNRIGWDPDDAHC